MRWFFIEKKRKNQEKVKDEMKLKKFQKFSVKNLKTSDGKYRRK